jgi:hypothetical protein
VCFLELVELDGGDYTPADHGGALNIQDMPYEKAIWSLRNDDLAAQSQECLDFLASLLR